jgi:dolichol kinase
LTAATAGSALDLQLNNYAADLRAFLEAMPARLKQGALAHLRAECTALLEGAPEATGERWARLRHTLAELRQALDSGAARAYLTARYEEAARAYEHWMAARRAPRAPLQPLKGARTIFHVAMALLATVMYQFVLTRAQAVVVLLTLLTVFASLEITRRIWPRWNEILVRRVFGAISRPREYHEVNSATWYLVALCVLTPFFSRPALLCGVLVLGIGDPAAAWAGKSWGRLKLYGNKSLVGSLAFVISGALVALAFLLAFYPALPWSNRVAAALIAAFCGALAELFSTRVDDNLTVPIAAVTAASLFL